MCLSYAYLDLCCGEYYYNYSCLSCSLCVLLSMCLFMLMNCFLNASAICVDVVTVFSLKVIILL